MSSKILSTHTDLTLDSTARLRMSGQNRTRYLNTMAKATLGSNFVIANTTWTLVTWDTEEFDTDTMHSVSSNTSRVIAQIAGKYLVVAQANWTVDTSANARAILVAKNAAGSFGSGTTLSSNTFSVVTGFGIINQLCLLVTMSASDYIECFAYNNSGGNDHISTTASFLAMYYIGE